MNKQELAAKVWRMANKMRSKIKAVEYKDYILGFIFYKFLSFRELDFLKSQGMTEELKAMDDGDLEFIKERLGYAIQYKYLFSTLKGMGIKLDAKFMAEALDDFNKNINEHQETVFKNIFNTLEQGVAKLGDNSGSRDKAVRDIIGTIDIIPVNKNVGYDVLGYVYEFLTYKFATAAKDDGAFYTPHEVSSLMAQIIAHHFKDKNLKEMRVYDPTSGSAGLLLNIGQESSRYVDKDKIKYYAQEMITETYHLTRMNLVMKGIGAANIFVRNGDTLEDDWPYFDGNDVSTYVPLFVDAVVSNPPYSHDWIPRPLDERFKGYGLAPSSKADLAFLLHCLYHLNNDGIMAIVMPHGILFRDEEYEIRKNLCEKGNIRAIISLPGNLFYSTTIPTTIIVLGKDYREERDILFIDASQSFEKGKNQNILRDCDIKRIFDAVVARENIHKFAYLASFDEIKAKDYNLNIPGYVSASKDPVIYDLVATVKGLAFNKEIEQFSCEWSAFKSLRGELYSDLGNGYSSFNDVVIRDAVTSNNDVIEYFGSYRDKIYLYRGSLVKKLIRTSYAINVKELQEKLVEELFFVISSFNVMDKYEVYQLFMNTWHIIETDMAIIGNDRSICRSIEPNMVVKTVKKEEIEVQQGWKGTIIPFDIVGNTYFKADYEKLKDLKNKVSALEANRDSIFDSLDDELKKIVGDGDKFKEAELKKYLKANKVQDDLEVALENIAEIKKLNKEIKKLDEEILIKIKNKIENLTDAEIDDMLTKKWIDPMVADIIGYSDTLSNVFVKDLEGLKAKYAVPLSKINADIKKKDEELADLFSQLTGSDLDMEAISLLKQDLL